MKSKYVWDIEGRQEIFFVNTSWALQQPHTKDPQLIVCEFYSDIITI